MPKTGLSRASNLRFCIVAMCSWHRAHGTSDSNGGNRDRDRHGGRSKQKVRSGDGRRLTQVLVQHFPKRFCASTAARPALDERGPRSPESVGSRNSSDRVSGRRRFRMEIRSGFLSGVEGVAHPPEHDPGAGFPPRGRGTDWSNPLETALFCLEQICPKDRFDKGTRRTEVHYGVDEWN